MVGRASERASRERTYERWAARVLLGPMEIWGRQRLARSRPAAAKQNNPQCSSAWTAAAACLGACDRRAADAVLAAKCAASGKSCERRSPCWRLVPGSSIVKYRTTCSLRHEPPRCDRARDGLIAIGQLKRRGSGRTQKPFQCRRKGLHTLTSIPHIARYFSLSTPALPSKTSNLPCGFPLGLFYMVRVHDLKHTFGRRLRAAGVSFEDRQDLLGHRAGRITTLFRF